MPFDLATAKPVSSGFDLSTATPVSDGERRKGFTPLKRRGFTPLTDAEAQRADPRALLKYRVTGPSGERYDVTAPEGATEAEILAVTQRHVAQLAADRADTERMADPTTGMGVMDKAAAGAGKFFSDVGAGAQQMAASVGVGDKAAVDTEVAESRKRDAPLMKSHAAKLGYFAPALTTAMIPGANTVAGGAITGAALGALQPTGEGESRVANTLVGGVFGTAGSAIGQEGGTAVRTLLAKRVAERAAAQQANAARDGVLAAGREAGYVVPPIQARPSMVNRAVEGMAGKTATAQAASAENQTITNQLIARELGLPEGQPITREALAAVRQKAGDAYENLAQGNYTTDAIFKERLAALTQRHRTLATEVPELADKEVLALAKSMSKDQFSGRTLVDAIGALREKATKAFASGDKGVGRVYRGMADEAEKLIERNLLAADSAKFAIAKMGGGVYQAPKDALSAFRESRQLMAKSYGAEGALEGSNINAAKYAQYLAKGKPLSGESKKVAQFAAEFPKAVQLPQRIGSQPSISSLDVALSVLGAAGGVATGGVHGLSGLGMLVARPALRAAVLSKPYEKMLAAPRSYATPLVERIAQHIAESNRLPAVAGTAAPDALFTQRAAALAR